MAAFVVCASAFATSAWTQPSADNSPASVTVQSSDGSLTMPPSVAAQLDAEDKKMTANSKAAELFAPVTKANTPKIYTKPVSSGPTEMDLRQLWNELKINNPQLSSLRESYLSAKATMHHLSNIQVVLVATTRFLLLSLFSFLARRVLRPILLIPMLKLCWQAQSQPTSNWAPSYQRFTTARWLPKSNYRFWKNPFCV